MTPSSQNNTEFKMSILIHTKLLHLYQVVVRGPTANMKFSLNSTPTALGCNSVKLAVLLYQGCKVITLWGAEISVHLSRSCDQTLAVNSFAILMHLDSTSCGTEGYFVTSNGVTLSSSWCKSSFENIYLKWNTLCSCI